MASLFPMGNVQKTKRERERGMEKTQKRINGWSRENKNMGCVMCVAFNENITKDIFGHISFSFLSLTNLSFPLCRGNFIHLFVPPYSSSSPMFLCVCFRKIIYRIDDCVLDEHIMVLSLHEHSIFKRHDVFCHLCWFACTCFAGNRKELWLL